MTDHIYSALGMIGRRIRAFLHDPLLEHTLDGEIAGAVLYSRQSIYRVVGVIGVAFGLCAMVWLPADLLSRLVFGITAGSLVGLLSLYSIMVGHLIMRALGSRVTRLEYASIIIHELPITVSIGAVCSLANTIGSVAGVLPIFVFSAMLQIVPFYRSLLLAGVRKSRAVTATLVIFGFFFVLGLSYGIAVGASAPVVPLYDLGVANE